MKVKGRPQEVPLAQLVLDFSFYPRVKINPYKIREMAESLRAGKSPPPIIVDRATNRIVDGFHRYHAYLKVYGSGATIPAILKDYATENDCRLEAWESNATHGQILSLQDKVRCIALAETCAIPPERVAAALSITLERLHELRAERLATYKLEPVPLKGAARHYAGLEMSDSEFTYNLKAGGPQQLFYINQVIAMLHHEAVNWANPRLVVKLQELKGLLDTALLVRV